MSVASGADGALSTGYDRSTPAVPGRRRLVLRRWGEVLVAGVVGVTSSSSVPQLLESEERWEARKYLRALFVANYRDESEGLSERLKGTKSPTLLWLCWGLDRVRSEATDGVPFAEWETFVPTVVEAARLRPKVMLPQVAWLLVRDRVVMSRETRPQYAFNPDAARLLGGIEAVAELFEREEAADWASSPAVEAVLAYLRERAGAVDTEPA